MTHCVALLRGINVGRAKRIAMADLRDLMESLGFSEVRTLLNSGNVVFRANKVRVRGAASAMETGIKRRFGFPVPVIVHTAQELDVIVSGNTLSQASRDPAKFLVAFVATAATLTKCRPLLAQSLTPEAFVMGDHAAYLWCANGIIKSRLMKAFSSATADAATTRNWATVLKLQAAMSAGRDGGGSGG